jgi:hypothetical protein
MNILKNKPIMQIYKYSVRTFTFLNKYLYLISILSIITSIYSKLRGNKFYKILSSLIKLFLFVNLLVGTGFILYLTDFVTPLNTTLSIYSDYFQSYIEILTRLYNDLIKYNIEDSIISQVKETNNIKNQIKEGMKEGVKEAFDEIVTDLQDDYNSKAKSDLLKQVALFGSVLFIGYFLFILPGTAINPEELAQYNWMNQSLIELKQYLISYFFNNPGNPGGGVAPQPGGSTSITPDTPINPSSTPQPVESPQISPTNSITSGSTLSTVTPNTPVCGSAASNINLFTTDANTQTILEGRLITD